MNKKDAFMIALLDAPTTKEAYTRAGVAPRTAYNYLKDEEFKKELQARRGEVLRDSIHHLQANLATCTRVLMEIVTDAGTPASVKVQAINSVFSNYKNLSKQSNCASESKNWKRRGKWMKTYTIKFKDIQGEKLMHLTQRDVALFMLEFSRDIEVISVLPQKRRRIRGEQPA